MKPQVRLLMAANAALDAYDRADFPPDPTGSFDDLARAMDDLAQVVSDVTSEVMQ